MAKKNKHDSPDTNINHIAIIESLAISMAEHFQALNATCSEQYEAKTEAQDYLHLFEVNQIKTCRDVFED